MELNNEKTLVLNCLFSPDNPFTFYISTTSSPIENYDNSTTDFFRIILSNTDDILIDSTFQGNQLDLDLIPSHTSYFIEVQSDEFPAIQAVDSLPKLVEISDAFLIYPAGVDAYGELLAEANISFRDPQNTPNYYELLIYSGDNYHHFWSWNDDVDIVDPVLLNEGDIDYLPTSLFFSDQLFDGDLYTMKVKQVVATVSGNPVNQYVILRSVSETYYYYRKYYTRHAYNQQFQGDFLDLVFKGEPQNMYTNVENGYGIFSGYVQTSRVLRYDQ